MLKRIPLDQITRNPDQPRQTFDARALNDLADSIKENGLKQPITVRPSYLWSNQWITNDKGGTQVMFDRQRALLPTPQVSSMAKVRLDGAQQDTTHQSHKEIPTTDSKYSQTYAMIGEESEVYSEPKISSGTPTTSCHSGQSAVQSKSFSSSKLSDRYSGSRKTEQTNFSQILKSTSKRDATHGRQDRTKSSQMDGPSSAKRNCQSKQDGLKAPFVIEQNALASIENLASQGEKPEPIYVIVMGERRYRAHLILQEAGLEQDILCHVREMDDREMHIDAILENLQRAEVSPLEEAMAYQKAIDELGFTVPDLAKKLGISQHWRITDRIRLLGLTEDNRALLNNGIITQTQGYHMAALSQTGQQEFLALVKQGLVSTNQAAEQAAAAIEAKENQSEMAMVVEMPKRKSIKSTEARIDALGAALMPLFKDGPFKIDGTIDPDAARRCIEKLRLLNQHVGQVRREMERAASVSAAA